MKISRQDAGTQSDEQNRTPSSFASSHLGESQKSVVRLKGVVRGAVQGVGFRPFVYRLATELGLTGWVLNFAQGVFIEVEGERATLDQFRLRFDKTKPPRAIIHSAEFSFFDAVGYDTFEIRHSDERGAKPARRKMKSNRRSSAYREMAPGSASMAPCGAASFCALAKRSHRSIASRISAPSSSRAARR